MMDFELALDNIYIDRFRLIKIGEFWIVENMVDLGENYIFAEKAFSLWILWTSCVVSMMDFELGWIIFISIDLDWLNMIDLGENYIFAKKYFQVKS